MKKLRRVLWAALCTVIVLSCNSPAGSDTSPAHLGRVYISNAGTATVSVIDLDTLSLVDTIDLSAVIPGGSINQSHYMEVTGDEKYIWVGESWGSVDGQMLVVDVASHQVLKTFDVGAACGQHLSHDGKWIFAVSEKKGAGYNGDTYNNVINIFDVEGQRYLGNIAHGSAPHVLETSPDGKTLWTTNHSGGKLFAYDISGLPDTLPAVPKTTIDIFQQLQDDYSVSAHHITLHGLAVHPAGSYVIVGRGYADTTEGGRGDIVVDIETEKIVTVIPGIPHNYDISPDGNYLLAGEAIPPDAEELAYLSAHGFGTPAGPLVRRVAIGDPASIHLDGIIDAGPWGISSINHEAYDPSGTYIIVTVNRGIAPNTTGEAVIVDAKTLKKIKTIPVGKNPHAVVFPGYGR
jgi:DNA-binding beta-propeller fold protein YncE